MLEVCGKLGELEKIGDLGVIASNLFRSIQNQMDVLGP